MFKEFYACVLLAIFGTVAVAAPVKDSRLSLKPIEKLECKIIKNGETVATRIIEEETDFSAEHYRMEFNQQNANDLEQVYKVDSGVITMGLRFQTLGFSPPSKSYIDEGVAAWISYQEPIPGTKQKRHFSSKGFLMNLDDTVSLDVPEAAVRCRLYRENRTGISDSRSWYN